MVKEDIKTLNDVLEFMKSNIKYGLFDNLDQEHIEYPNWERKWV